MIKILENDNKYLAAFFGFAILGFIGNPLVLGIFAYVLVIIGLIDIFRNNNSSGEAHLYMGLFGTLELFLRMAKSISPHEISKYTIIIFSLFGIFFTRNRRKPNGLGIFFIVLMLPSLVRVDTNMEMWFEIIMTTVLGPLGLGTLLIYFFRYEMNRIDIRNLIRAILLPVSSILVYIQTNTVAFDELADVSYVSSNFSLSGNFGPNQVSVIMGISAGLLLYSLFFGIPIFKYRIMDMAILGFCVFRGFLTFSRGGISVPFIAFGFVVLLSFVRVRNLQALKKGIYLIFGALIFYLIFLLTNSLTGSALEKRYSGETGSSEKTGEKDLLSGRDQIMFIDLQIFADNLLLGVGPGMAKPLRYYYGFANSVSAHIEFSRILAEHGLLGLLAIFIYTFIIVRKRNYWKAFPNETFFLLFIWWIGFLNSNHNSFRLGLTVLFLGMIVARIRIKPEYFTKQARKVFPEEWKQYEIQNDKALAPKTAESDPGKRLETNITFPR